MWIEKGPRPVPHKYVLTTTDEAGIPEFTVELRDWDLEAKHPEDLFRFVPPAGAEQIEFLGHSLQRGKKAQGGAR